MVSHIKKCKGNRPSSKDRHPPRDADYETTASTNTGEGVPSSTDNHSTIDTNMADTGEMSSASENQSNGEEGICDESTPFPNDMQDHMYSVPTQKEQQTESSFLPLKKKIARKPCVHCGKIISVRWMKSHMKIHQKHTHDIDKDRHHHTIIVDSNKGIFCSAVNLRGIFYPIHLIKRTTGLSQDSFCENRHCMDFKETAKHGGNVSFECDHIRSTQYAVHGEQLILQETVLQEMQDANFFTEDRFDELQAYKRNSPREIPLVVRLPSDETSSQRYIYLSVFSGDQRYWSRVGRTIVSYDKMSNVFSCQCSKSKRYCSTQSNRKVGHLPDSARRSVFVFGTRRGD